MSSLRERPSYQEKTNLTPENNSFEFLLLNFEFSLKHLI